MCAWQCQPHRRLPTLRWQIFWLAQGDCAFCISTLILYIKLTLLNPDLGRIRKKSKVSFFGAQPKTSLIEPKEALANYNARASVMQRRERGVDEQFLDTATQAGIVNLMNLQLVDSQRLVDSQSATAHAF